MARDLSFSRFNNWVLNLAMPDFVVEQRISGIREWVRYVTTQLSCILNIMLTTTCFGHCGPSSGHRNVYRGDFTQYGHSIGAYCERNPPLP